MSLRIPNYIATTSAPASTLCRMMADFDMPHTEHRLRQTSHVAGGWSHSSLVAIGPDLLVGFWLWFWSGV